MGLVLALPLALQDPLPDILGAVGGVQREAWGGHALAIRLDGALAVAEGRRHDGIET